MKLYFIFVLAFFTVEAALAINDAPREKRQIYYSDIQDKPKSFRPRAKDKEAANSATAEDDSFISGETVSPFNPRPSSGLKVDVRPASSYDDQFLQNPAFDAAPQKPPHEESYQIHKPFPSYDETKPYRPRPVHNQPAPAYESPNNRPKPAYEESYNPKPIHPQPGPSYDEPEPYRPRPVHNQPAPAYESPNKRPKPAYEESYNPKPIHPQSGPSYDIPHKRPKPATKPYIPVRKQTKPNTYPTSIRKIKRPLYGQRQKPAHQQSSSNRPLQRRRKPVIRKPHKSTSASTNPTAFINQSSGPKLSVHKAPHKIHNQLPLQYNMYRPNSDESDFGEQPIPKASIKLQNPRIYEELQHVPSNLLHKPKPSVQIHRKPSSYNEDPHLGLTSSAVYEQDTPRVNQFKGNSGYQRPPHSYRVTHKPKPAYEETYNPRPASPNRDHLISKASFYAPKTSGDHSQKPTHLSYNKEHKKKSNAIPGVAGKDYPTYREVPHTSFSCKDVPTRPGMYANPEAGCQAYHVCHDNRHGDQGASFLCTNGTVFNQETFSCDWWFNVDCSKAKSLYSLNSDPKFNPYYQKPYEEKYHESASEHHQNPSFVSYNPQPPRSYRHHPAATASTLLGQGTTTKNIFLQRPNTPQRTITRPFQSQRASKVRQIIRKASPSALPKGKNYEFQNFETVKSFLKRFEDESESTNLKGLSQPSSTADSNSETIIALKRITRRRDQPRTVQIDTSPQQIPEMLVEEIPEGAVIDLEWGQRSTL